MAYDKKRVDEIGNILASLAGPYAGQDVPQDTLALVEELTIGDLIIEFNCSVDDAAQVLSNITFIRRKNKPAGFSINEKPVVESKLVARLRKVVKECCDEHDMGVEMSSDYHPVSNDMGGQTFEDSGQSEEAGMIKSNLYSIYTKSQSLHDMVGDTDDLPEWVQEKIAVVGEYVNVIHDYLEYEYRQKGM